MFSVTAMKARQLADLVFPKPWLRCHSRSRPKLDAAISYHLLVDDSMWLKATSARLKLASRMSKRSAVAACKFSLLRVVRPSHDNGIGIRRLRRRERRWDPRQLAVDGLGPVA